MTNDVCQGGGSAKCGVAVVDVGKKRRVAVRCSECGLDAGLMDRVAAVALVAKVSASKRRRYVGSGSASKDAVKKPEGTVKKPEGTVKKKTGNRDSVSADAKQATTDG